MVSADARTVAFRWEDHRISSGDSLAGIGLSASHERGQRIMRLATPGFIRRFLTQILPDGFHRIRPCWLLASADRKANIARIHALLCVQRPEQANAPGPEAEIIPLTLREPCPCRGGTMRIVETVRRGQKPMSRAPPRGQAA
jgi:hypothetical protein